MDRGIILHRRGRPLGEAAIAIEPIAEPQQAVDGLEIAVLYFADQLAGDAVEPGDLKSRVLVRPRRPAALQLVAKAFSTRGRGSRCALAISSRLSPRIKAA
jgi:hypothetical protein